jgi:hypothetical protein
VNADPKGAITLDGGDGLTDKSSKVARIWVTDGAGSSVWIDAGLLENPVMFGYLMADTIRHAARAYAGTWTIDGADALQRIVDGVPEELRDQVSEITTIQEGRLN